MIGQRLPLALDSGFALPDSGAILVVGPRASDDLSALPSARIRAVQGFRPDHDAIAAAGIQVAPRIEGAGHAAAVVCLPRSRAAALDAVARAADALAPGAPLLLDGQKTDGIEAMLRACKGRVPLMADPVSKAHGKAFAIVPGTAFADWRADPARIADGFVTRAGVFSADGPDPGSVLLTDTLPDAMPGRVADLGAGWGFLGAAVLRRAGVAELHVVEADHAALDCARDNLPDPRVRFHWADATRFDAATRFDWIVTNPPFHTGRAADTGLGMAFLQAAARLLAPGGTALIVANRHLPYERTLADAFASVDVAAETSAFKVFRARRPRTLARPRGIA